MLRPLSDEINFCARRARKRMRSFILKKASSTLLLVGVGCSTHSVGVWGWGYTFGILKKKNFLHSHIIDATVYKQLYLNSADVLNRES